MKEQILGPFGLIKPIGKGAMGVVWQARHRGSGIPVAIKILQPKGLQRDIHTQSFFNEVRAVAQLDHPGIAMVLDYGTVNATTAAASDGLLEAGTPYLVMEYASRGTLDQPNLNFNWSELRAVLLALLDALAHAHARGVIHRDLKPANVLLCSRRDPRPGLKLCDFGIAFAMEEAHTDSTVAGTLHYMAPEQLEGRQREQGPWTDLYAFGCLTWKLVTGFPVFRSLRSTQLVFAQLRKSPPPLITDTPLPTGFESWLRKLLEKRPQDRFRNAASAATALIHLGHPSFSGPSEDMRTGIVPPVVLTENLHTSEAPADLLTTQDTATLAAAPTTLWLQDRADISSAASIPLDWRRPSRAHVNWDLVGAGLQLFGLRVPAFVGREAERDLLWNALTRVHEERRSIAVMLTGHAGTGKTRLAEWLGERASEVGAANVLRAHFADTDTVTGFRDMLLSRFHARGLEGDQLTRRLNDALDEHDVHDVQLRANAHLLLTGQELSGPSRYAVIRLLLEAISQERPVVILLDDVHVGIDAIRFTRHLLGAQAGRPFPALLLLTKRDDEKLDRELQHESKALCSDPDLISLPVAPLPRGATMELIHQILGLEPILAEQVVERTAGNPLFAMQLVGDWIERDVLVLGKKGFKLKPGTRHRLPPSLKYIWIKRLNRVLDGAEPGSDEILEAAAVLGMTVDLQLWSGTCADPEGIQKVTGKVQIPSALRRKQRVLMHRLFQLHLAEKNERGFQFTHGQFRDAILDRARAADHLKHLHHAAACQFGHNTKDADLERYGRHLLQSGAPEAAIDPLLRAVPCVQSTVGRMSAWRLLDTVEQTLKNLLIPVHDERWGRMYLERALLSELLGQHREGVKWAAKAGREASIHGWKSVAAAANFRLGRAAMRKGDTDMASARFTRVLNQIDESKSPFLVGEAMFMLAQLGRHSGESPAEIERLSRDAHRLMLKNPDPRKRARALLHFARAALQQGRFERCETYTERARKIAVQLGDLPQQVSCLAFASEVSRASGDLSNATEKLRSAIDVFELIGDAQLALLRCNLAIVLLDRGLITEALKELDRALSNATEVDRDPLRFAVLTVRLRAFAEADRYADLEEALRGCEAILDKISVGEKDSADCAQRAYELLRQSRHPRQAERCRRIAAELYSKLSGDTAAKAGET